MTKEKQRYLTWLQWFRSFESYPELRDTRLKIMLTLITIDYKSGPHTHVKLQELFQLTDKTVRGLRQILVHHGWTAESFTDRQICISPTDKAKELFNDYKCYPDLEKEFID